MHPFHKIIRDIERQQEEAARVAQEERNTLRMQAECRPHIFSPRTMKCVLCGLLERTYVLGH